MNADEMTDRITEALQRGIRETIENRDPEAFEQAAKEAYGIRTGGKALTDEDAIINHVFPSDVRQTVALGLHLADSDREKASVILKGALESVLQRLSAVPPGDWAGESAVAEAGKKRWWWPFGGKQG